LEAKDLDDLRAQLREKYPEGAFERTLHYVRDPEAEERRERALNGLIELLAERVVEQMIEEESRDACRHRYPSTQNKRLRITSYRPGAVIPWRT
jgi:hypothetical protein